MNKHCIEEGEPLNNYKHYLKIMRITLFFLFFCILFSSAANSFSQEFTFNQKSASIREICKQIEKGSDYVFVFSDSSEKMIDKKVNIDANAKNVAEILDAILSNTGLTYEILDKQIIIYESGKIISAKVPEHKIPEDIIQQPPKKQITGRIVDTQGEAIIGANIIEVGTTNGTVTDMDGNFTLSVEPDATIRISYIGYLPQDINTAGKSSFNIVLQEDTQALEEVVVVGYGIQKKVTLTGAVSTLRNKEILQSPTANVSSALVGRIPGISSLQPTGEPGYNQATIRIRGVSTLNTGGHDPVIIIDGVQTTFQQFNSLDFNDIQSISVLKDASSTAVYGIQGANGVIIVTTKRGESGSPRISMSYRYGISQATNTLKMLGSYEYALFRNEAILNDKEDTYMRILFDDEDIWKFKNNRDYTDAEIDAMNLTPDQKNALRNSPALYYSSHDLYSDQFGGSSPQQQLNVNISGGTENFRYYTSVGYLSQDGLFKDAKYAGKDVNSHYDRYNIRSNIDVDIAKNLEMSIEFGGQFEKNSGIKGKDGDVTSLYSRYKEMTVTILGSPPWSLSGFYDGKLVSDIPGSVHPLGDKGGYYNPTQYLLTRNILNFYNTNVNSTITLTHDMEYLTEGLTLSGRISYNGSYRKGWEENIPVPSYSMYRNPENPLELIYVGGVTYPSSIYDKAYQTKRTQLYLEGKLNYQRTFGDHNVSGMVLYNARRTKYPGLLYGVPEGMLGLASRVTYDYDNRYLAELNIGYNGSENFPPEKRFGLFPAYSLGWIASNESFFPKNDWITWLKFRGSYGITGNDRVGGRRFLYLPSTWAYTGTGIGNGYRFGSTDGTFEDPKYGGAREGAVGNPNVTWEKAQKINAGVEITFLRNRLSFTGDFFQEKRNNILWNRGSVPSIVAADLPPANIGEVNNKGYEIVVSWRDNIQDFNYGIGANVSYARNKIIFQDEPENPYEWMNSTGFSLGQYKGFKINGFYNNEEQASNRPYVPYDGNRVQAGDIRYIDIDGDGTVDNHDRVPIGYSNLPRYAFAGNLDFSYKGFSVSALFTGTLQGSMLITATLGDNYITNPFYMGDGAAMVWQYEGHWTPEKAEQGGEITFPRASMRTSETQNAQMNELWLRSSEFLRLKNLEISYTFPELRYLKQMGISNVRVYVNGNNLATWRSKLVDGYDPEQMDANAASDGYLYPPMKSYNLGINVTF